MIDVKTGRRYETCSICGLSWNVANTAAVPDDGYLCPMCRWRLKKDEIFIKKMKERGMKK